MTEEKTCYNCGNKNCNVYYSMVKKDCNKHFETYEYKNFDCVDHDKWEELKMEEIHTDNTKTLQNAMERIEELEKENAELKENFRICEKNADTYFDNFTKAKEIIKKFLLWENDWHNKTESKYELLKQAEQFLEETE